MGRVDGDKVLVWQQRLMERPEHRGCVRPRVLRAQQVRPADGPDEQRAAREQEERLIGAGRVGHGVRDVLRRVPRRVEHRELEAADHDPVTTADRPVLVCELRACPDHVDGARDRSQLPRARHVVVVEVRLEDVADHQIAGRGGLQVDVHVPAGVDDRGQAGRLVGDQRREVTEALDRELAD
jgi:hypothetical protein